MNKGKYLNKYVIYPMKCRKEKQKDMTNEKQQADRPKYNCNKNYIKGKQTAHRLKRQKASD